MKSTMTWKGSHSLSYVSRLPPHRDVFVGGGLLLPVQPCIGMCRAPCVTVELPGAGRSQQAASCRMHQLG